MHFSSIIITNTGWLLDKPRERARAKTHSGPSKTRFIFVSQLFVALVFFELSFHTRSAYLLKPYFFSLSRWRRLHVAGSPTRSVSSIKWTKWQSRRTSSRSTRFYYAFYTISCNVCVRMSISVCVCVFVCSCMSSVITVFSVSVCTHPSTRIQEFKIIHKSLQTQLYNLRDFVTGRNFVYTYILFSFISSSLKLRMYRNSVWTHCVYSHEHSVHPCSCVYVTSKRKIRDETVHNCKLLSISM